MMLCPVCEERELEVFFEAPAMPVHSNVLCPDPEAALRVPRGDIRLGICESCGMIHNVAFEPQLMSYDQRYDNNLSHSPSFRDFARALARRLAQRWDLREKTIVEIGCGKGDFLEVLCREGQSRGIGYDPSYEGPESREDGRLTFVREFYREEHAEEGADLVVSRHVLEHVPSPVAFLQQVRRTIGERETAVYFEVPDARWTLEGLGVWDVIYEHCSYFADESLTRAFERAGFGVVHVESGFGGQFLGLEALPETNGASPVRSEESAVDRLVEQAARFGDRYREKVAGWSELLEALPDARVALWGAGSKGVTFLNTVEAARRIDRIVDLNPNKQGKFVAGSGQRIVSPRELSREPPDLIIVMNPNYRDEVERQAAEVGCDAAIAVV